jgi:uncharacterized protein YbjT (DUF2867 family)
VRRSRGLRKVQSTAGNDPRRRQRRAGSAPCSSSGSPQRLAVRYSRARATAPRTSAPNVEIVEGDVRAASDVERAVAGAHVVVSAVHGFVGSGGVSPASVDRDGNRHLIDAAARAGAAVVLLSVVGASAEARWSSSG